MNCKQCGTKLKKSKTGFCLPCAIKQPKSAEWKRKVSIAQSGDRNPQWKGDAKLNMSSLHEWVRSHKPIPTLCEECGKVPPLDLANRGVYDRNFDNWEYLCRRCHMTKDGRIKTLKNLNRGYIIKKFGHDKRL